MKLLPLLQHGLAENVQLVGVLVLCPVDPPVVSLAVLQAGQDSLLGLVDGGHCWWRLERTGAEVWTPVVFHLGLHAETVLADVVTSLLLGVCLVLIGGLLSTPTLWVSFLAISVAIFSGHHLLAGVEDPLGPFGCLTGHCLCDCLEQRQVLLGAKVLLQLHVVDSVDEQAEDDRLTVVELSLAGQVGAGEPHVALPGLGLEVGEEALDRLAWLLPDFLEFLRLLISALRLDTSGANTQVGVLGCPRCCRASPFTALTGSGSGRTPPGQ
jgi:uncharacterized membrane protein YphA (DoxX/SURF4 family)